MDALATGKLQKYIYIIPAEVSDVPRKLSSGKCMRSSANEGEKAQVNDKPEKNEGDRGDRSNYRSIPLRSIVGKLLDQGSKFLQKVYPESHAVQCREVHCRHRFSFKQLRGKCRVQRRPLCIAFIDLHRPHSPRLLTLSAETAFSWSWPTSAAPQHFSASWSHSAKTRNGPSSAAG